MTAMLQWCVCVSRYLHPQAHVVHLEGGVGVVEVHLEAHRLAGDGRQEAGVVGGRPHVQRVVTAAARLRQLDRRPGVGLGRDKTRKPNPSFTFLFTFINVFNILRFSSQMRERSDVLPLRPPRSGTLGSTVSTAFTFCTRASVGWSVTAGAVLGMAHTRVTPPASAAAVPDEKSSL